MKELGEAADYTEAAKNGTTRWKTRRGMHMQSIGSDQLVPITRHCGGMIRHSIQVHFMGRLLQLHLELRTLKTVTVIDNCLWSART